VTVIAMTRELGSRGTDVAAGIAHALNLEIVHSEIAANHVAERLGVDEAAVRRYVDGSASLFERWHINRRRLSRYTCEEILRLAQTGNVLIRGWGAATLLRDLPQVISVRICAPMEFRVRVMMVKLGTTDAVAVREEIERFDAAHVRSIRAAFDIDEEDPLLYHVVLNTGRIPVEACVAAVCALARDKGFQDAPTRTALADRLIEARINSALTEEIGIGMAPAGLRVSAENGRVTLAGRSTSGNLRSRAEKVAARIVGPGAIDNRIVSVPARGGQF
jgi:cytidylate kinase